MIFTQSFPRGGFVSLGEASILTLLLKPPIQRTTSSWLTLIGFMCNQKQFIVIPSSLVPREASL